MGALSAAIIKTPNEGIPLEEWVSILISVSTCLPY